MKRLTARFYATAAGNRPVRDWLMNLAEADRFIVTKDMFKVEIGWPIGLPVCGPIGSNLYEVRSTIVDGKVEARVYFTVIGDVMFLLAAHDGKGRQQGHVQTARDRLADYKQRERERVAAEKKANQSKK